MNTSSQPVDSLDSAQLRAVPPVNLSRGGRRVRSLLGYAALLAAATLAVWMVWHDVPSVWRLALIMPFAAGFVGVMQARAGT